MITEKMIGFLAENRYRNSKEWFLEHKDIYISDVLDPLCGIVKELTPLMLSVDPNMICEPRVDKTISRIYRDTRFSNDRSLYRDEVWISFTRDRKRFPAFPQFFLYITPRKFAYGCGYYAASSESMKSIRAAILSRRPEFSAALECLERNKQFVLSGEKYKKDKFPSEPERCKNWLNRKSVCAMTESTDFDLLFAPDLTDRLCRDFEKLEPLYGFLVYAEENKAE